MARQFLLPDPGEGIHEADILEIHVSSGDEVKDGDPLFSVETDKAVVDIPSSFDGTIEDVRVEVGDVVEVGSVLLTYTGPGEESDGEPTATEPSEEAREDHEEPEGTGESDEDDEPEEAEKTEKPEDGEPEEADESEKPEETDETDEVEEAEEHVAGGRPKQPPVPASPATRSLAKRLGVDLHELEGSGPEGRIEPQDVQAAAGETADATEPEREEAREPDRADEVEDVEWVQLRGVRRASAAQMTRSWNEIPHVTHHDVADITELETMRKDHAGELESEGGRLSMTVFLMKAAAVALGEHPRFNAILDADNDRVGIKTRVNIGVAVDTDDGLVVPVIHDVDSKSIADIAVELTEVAGRMRNGDRSLDDMQGGTFTITNPGGIGGTSFNPIINHPEVAILGAARASETPVLGDNGSLEGRLHLPLVLAFDHRVNDGADAARFMNTIKRLLEDPAELMLRA